MSDFADKFQCMSIYDDFSDEEMNEERVYSIHQIAPDNFLDVLKTPKTIHRKSRINDIISSQLKKPDSTDITLQIGDEMFKIPIIVLQSYSKYFQTRSCHEKVIDLSSFDISADVFHMIYEWMLNTSKMLRRENLISLLMGAQFLQVPLLEQQIWNLIQDGEKFQESEAYLLYLEAKHCRCENVQNMMMSRVQKFFMTVVCSEEFLMMEPYEIHNWLKLDSIGVNTEVEVFYSAARWLLHDWERRKEFLVSLLKLIRLGLIEPWRLVEFRRNNNQGKLTTLLENDEAQALLESSLSYAAYKFSCNDDSCERFADFLSRFGFKRLYSRDLMLDNVWQRIFKNTPYTYEHFEEYLNIIRSNALVNWKNNVIFKK